MAREIAVIVHCDQCQTVLDDNRPQIPPIDLGDGPREIDLCDAHYSEVWVPLHDLYAKAAAPAGPPPTGVGVRKRGDLGYNGRARPPMPEMTCPEDGCDKWIKNRDLMRSHLRNHHNTTIGAVQARLGRGLNGDPISHRCDVCGDAFATGQDWGQHRRQAHPGIGKAGRAPASARVA